jgi:hypothetical protein
VKFTERVTEDHMVAAFLRAEIGSPDFGRDCYMTELRRLGLGRALVDTPDLADKEANTVRKHLLGTCGRGYPDANLFHGWPPDVKWWNVEVTPAELADFRFCNDDAWIRLSGGSRFVRDGAANVGRVEDLNVKINEVAVRVRDGYPFPELLLVATTRDAPVVIMEGNKRAAAYVRAGNAAPDPIQALAGLSPKLTSWPFLGRL